MPTPIPCLVALRRTLPVLLTFTLTLLLAEALPSVGWAKEGTKSYSIESGPATTTLKEFAEQSGRSVLFSTEKVQGISTNAIRGELTAEEALDRLLSGTRLSAVPEKSTGGFAIRREVSVEVAEKNDSSRPANSRAADNVQDGVVKLDTFEVFGKKTLNMDIRRTQDDPQPYVVFNQQSISRSGAVNLEDFLQSHLPSVAGKSLSGQYVGVTGAENAQISNLGLRGLGNDETLILIDGRRIAGTQVYQGSPGQPNVNGIPLAAIERVEVLPATASGIYGGGATGGVVNIVLRRDYSGTVVSLTYGNTFKTDTRTRRAELAGSLPLEDGRTRLMYSASWSDSKELTQADRDFVSRAYAHLLAVNPSAIFGVSFPPLGATTNIRSATGQNLTFKPAFGGGTVGSLITFVPYGYAGPGSDNGARLIANAGKYNLDLADIASRGGGRNILWKAPVGKTAMLSARREMSKWLTAFLDYSLSTTDFKTTASTARTVSIAGTAQGNPFNQNIYVTTPFWGADPLQTSHREETRASGGVVLDLPGDWNAEGDYTWSRTAIRSFGSLTEMNQNLLNSAIINGSLDLFRDTHAAGTDFGGYVNTPSRLDPAVVTLSSASLRAAGPLSLTETLRSVNLATSVGRVLQKTNDIYRYIPNLISLMPNRSQECISYYGELTVPVLELLHIGSKDSAIVQLALRHDEYETNGVSAPVTVDASKKPLSPIGRAVSKLNSTNPTFAVRYAPLRDISFRASYGEGFLPPSVEQVASNLNPVMIINLYGLKDSQRGGELIDGVPATTGGNPNLRPEKSRSTSAGLVLTPTFAPGLRLSIDFVEIQKSDAIFTPVRAFFQSEIDLLAQYAPQRFTRSAPSDGYPVGKITTIDASLINISKALSQSVDFALDYSRDDILHGRFTFTAKATQTRRMIEQLTPSAPEVDNAGTGFVKWRGFATIGWENSRWNFGCTARYTGAYFLNTSHTLNANQGSDHVRSQIFYDISVGYNFLDGKVNDTVRSRRLLRGVEVQLLINNVFNRSPALDFGLYASGIPATSVYGDPRLANYAITLKKHF